MAGIYNGYLLEFPQIRVDCFTSPTPKRPFLLPDPIDFINRDVGSSSQGHCPREIQYSAAPNARLYLLTHVHTDHLTGLSSTFTGKIVCSPDTKRMLLRLEAEQERKQLHSGNREIVKLKYEGLRARKEGKAIVDMIEAIPYGHPTDFEIGYADGRPQIVNITLLDANHCPGSTMFLIKSKDKAVLHTGDVRADSNFISSLRDNPLVGDFITTHPPSTSSNAWGNRILDRIYLDTSAILGTGDMPDRGPVLDELVKQMSMYPDGTVFFLNVWCFGWESVLKAVARHFRCPIHIDRYKRSIYSAIQTDPLLSSCTTDDAYSTRFHACDRFSKCDVCRVFDDSGKRRLPDRQLVVTVNMVEVKTAAWAVEQKAFREKLQNATRGEGLWPLTILCPIARHSPLPELQSLVKLFRPKSVSPNCVYPMFNGMDFFLLPSFMRDVIQPEGYESMVLERDSWLSSPLCLINRDKCDLGRYKILQAQGCALLQYASEAFINDRVQRRDSRQQRTTSSDGKSEMDLKLGGNLGAGQSGSLLFKFRSTQAADQLLRSGDLDLSAISPANLLRQVKLSHSPHEAGPAGLQLSGVQNADSIMKEISRLLGGETIQQEISYASDTDEEVENTRKRRRRRLVDYNTRQRKVQEKLARRSSSQLSLVKIEIQEVHEGKPVVDDPVNGDSKLCFDMSQTERGGQSQHLVNIESTDKPRLAWSSQPIINNHLTSDTAKYHSRAKTHPPMKKRFHIDKKHLAALYAVGEDGPME